MCQVVEMRIDDRIIRVADIKQPFMQNISDAAKKCDFIDRIMLFGSSTKEQCTEKSDIDLAVFGNLSPSKALTSKKYERFARQLYAFHNHEQAYDILYFKTGSRNKNRILEEIQEGEILYERSGS